LSDRFTLTERIRAEALRLGFFKTGITAAGPLPWQEQFDEWLSRGMHGCMSYLDRQAEKRRNVSLILGDVRSIVVPAMNYFVDIPHGGDCLKGRISRYAWGEDYHAFILGRLNRLLEHIRAAEPEARGLCYVDTGPVMEKVWGAQSSLGWMGKHSNLITRELGSWFFVGVILLNLELDYDAREKDFCGTCTRCLHACPTGAIIAPYVVDARLCLSYLTIEWKGVIPRPLRRLLGNRVFGCDDCQDVCPWNRFAKPAPEPAFQPRPGNLTPALSSLAAITDAEFESRFSGSPVRRARREALVRNAVVALGNSRSLDAIPALTRALRDASALVRGHAAWALGEVRGSAPPLRDSNRNLPAGESNAGNALEWALFEESDPWVREEIKLVLSRFQESGIRLQTSDPGPDSAGD